MNTFYVRLDGRALVIGDRDLFIEPNGDLFALKAANRNQVGSLTSIYAGTEENCEKLLDYILGYFPEVSESNECVLDLRPEIRRFAKMAIAC